LKKQKYKPKPKSANGLHFVWGGYIFVWGELKPPQAHAWLRPAS